MSIWAKLVMVMALAVVCMAVGIKWEKGQEAIRAQATQEAHESDAKQERQFNDLAAGKHAAALATVNNQLGNARETIARLSGRDCLDPRAVGLLNTVGGQPVPAAAGQPASTPTAASSGGGLRFATDRDLAGAIAVCRARYAEVSSQLDQILNIEDRRSPP